MSSDPPVTRNTGFRGGIGTGGNTPAMKQYWAAKLRHPAAILLFRMGDFYEVFFDDAVVAAPIMGVTLTSRPMRDGRQPMCGVPHHSWQGYVGKLLRAGKTVVICDQVEEPAGGGASKVVRREITRVLTPGTVVDDAYLEPGLSNWLVAAWSRGAEAGVAACDVSTGELMLCQLPLDRLQSEIDRLAPAELLQSPAIDVYRFDPERGRRRLADQLGLGFAASIGAEESPLAIGAAGVILEYLQHNQVRVEPGLFRVRTYSPDATMQLDAASVRNLELTSLLRLVDRTCTPIGARRLRRWIWAPLRDAEAIELRLGAVSELSQSRRTPLRTALREVGDLERLVGRAAQGLASPRELVALRRSLEALPAVAAACAAAASLLLRQLVAAIKPDPTLADELARALAEDPPAVMRDGGAIRPGYDPELDGIQEASRAAREWISDLERVERERTGIKSLKVGYNRVFGYYIEVSHANQELVPHDYIRKQTLTGAERYLTPELKEKEAVVLNANQDRVDRELEILRELQRRVAREAPDLLACAAAIGELDALASLAEAGTDLGWVRPGISTGLRLAIEGGRHPMVEASVGNEDFVPNDTVLDPAHEQIVVLTGPNMAGKSTYLRQVALIVLLAQCGSLVPARSASIGLADRIFTRVGAHDDLAAGMSTFMVEMTETANILAHASRSSLVVLDEVGRGTSTYDGVSIAQAVVEHIHDSPRLGCRTLFATHYHELTALADRLERVRNERVEVAEEGGSIRFLHRVVAGGADRSYGIHVAALAGLPPQLIARAREVLAELERQRPLEPVEQQLALPLVATENDQVRQELSTIELDGLSPLEALQKLYELRARLRGA
ncbi:MAG TPA: DNA mismatch repair protein MutS [Candidatus Dormibacteraeota bacterium]|nr:DNA mismatch repair protein MutS [Candidatus Dormibacteraeota bacterium]